VFICVHLWLTLFSRSPLVQFQSHALSRKSDAFVLEAQALVEAGGTRQGDAAACRQNAMPG
jgi:hypothetical protein